MLLSIASQLHMSESLHSCVQEYWNASYFRQLSIKIFCCIPWDTWIIVYMECTFSPHITYTNTEAPYLQGCRLTSPEISVYTDHLPFVRDCDSTVIIHTLEFTYTYTYGDRYIFYLIQAWKSICNIRKSYESRRGD